MLFLHICQIIHLVNKVAALEAQKSLKELEETCRSLCQFEGALRSSWQLEGAKLNQNSLENCDLRRFIASDVI